LGCRAGGRAAVSAAFVLAAIALSALSGVPGLLCARSGHAAERVSVATISIACVLACSASGLVFAGVGPSTHAMLMVATETRSAA